MPRRKYRKHSSSNRAFVEYKGERHYLPGEYESEESRNAYQLFLLGQWPPPEPEPPTVNLEDPPLQYLANKFLDHASVYYANGDPDEDKRSGYWDYFRAIRFVVGKKYQNLGQLPVSEYGPKRLKQLQNSMAKLKKARNTVNGVTTKIKTWIKWCVSEELCDAEVLHRLQSVRGLAHGRSEAPEPVVRDPARWEDVQPVFRFLHTPVRDMLWLQWYTGARSSSICNAKPEQFDQGPDGLWLWRPRHKTERLRTVILPIGPRCQAHIREYFRREPDAYMFSPLEVARATDDAREHYWSDTYGRAISRAFERALKWAKERKRKHKKQHIPRRWTPAQLRHARGTMVRERFGVEAASVILGHANVNITELYTSKALALAMRVAASMG